MMTLLMFLIYKSRRLFTLSFQIANYIKQTIQSTEDALSGHRDAAEHAIADMNKVILKCFSLAVVDNL